MTGEKEECIVSRELMGKMVEYAGKHEKSRWVTLVGAVKEGRGAINSDHETEVSHEAKTV
jgi:hypothetical protein